MYEMIRLNDATLWEMGEGIRNISAMNLWWCAYSSGITKRYRLTSSYFVSAHS